MLLEVIWDTKQFEVHGIKMWRIQHVLRNVLAFHILRIYETHGLRVAIPEYVEKQCPIMAQWFHTDFMKTCEYLKKDLPDGKYTATNVPFIIAFIVLCIKRDEIFVRAEIDGKPTELSEVFINRTGDVLPLVDFIKMKGQKGERCKPDDLWYFKHVKIKFGWTGGSKKKGMDLEELFKEVVYGMEPFDTADYRQPKSEQIMQIHFRSRINPIIIKMNIKDIDKVLRIVVVQEAKAKKTPACNGWLPAKEYGGLKDILKSGSYEDESEIRSRLLKAMQEMQQTYMARIVNIGMHIQLWGPTLGDCEIAAAEREIPDPLVRMTNLTEESLALLKAPVKAPTRGKKRKNLDDGGEEEKASQQLTIMDFPVALTEMSTDLLQRTSKLLEHCKGNHLSGMSLQMGYERLCQLKKPPTYKDALESEDAIFKEIEAKKKQEQEEAIPINTRIPKKAPTVQPAASVQPEETTIPPQPATPAKPPEPEGDSTGQGGHLPNDEIPTPPQPEGNSTVQDTPPGSPTRRVRGAGSPERKKREKSKRSPASTAFLSPEPRRNRSNNSDQERPVSEAKRRRMMADSNERLKKDKQKKEMIETARRMNQQMESSRQKRPGTARTPPSLRKAKPGSMMGKVSKSLRGLEPIEKEIVDLDEDELSSGSDEDDMPDLARTYAVKLATFDDSSEDDNGNTYRN